MRKSLLWICIILSMFFIPVSYALPPDPPNSYWGHASVNKILISDASITIHDASGNVIANATSLDSPNLGLYQVTVPWDDLTTIADEGVVAGETITIKVNGITTTSRVIDPKGSNTNIDLNVNTNSDTNGGTSGGTSGSTSGGTSGGSTGETNSNIECYENNWQYIDEGERVNFNFSNECNIVKNLNFTGAIKADRTLTKVEMLYNTSTLVEQAPPDEVYKNFNVWTGLKGWFTSNHIADPTLVFVVEKSWLENNNLDLSSVSLYWYNTNKWDKLSTQKINEDSVRYYFKANLPITGTLGSMAISGQTESPTTTETTPITDATATPGITETETKSTPGFPIFFVMLALISIWVVVRRRD
ncbi:MAG: PGF-pre-PGF domain-containing protein [ANME-2 cluster archaeon]|nr:PGF-pre-PGF domain-containing protein [ANME-2 cluster archaeon]